MATSKCLFTLLGLILPAIGFKIGHYDINLPARTVLSRGDQIGYRSIAPTPPPNPRFAAILKRDGESGTTCGYYEYNNEAFECFTSQDCVTSDNYFGCTSGSSPFTACLDGFNTVCSASRQGLGTLCCNYNTDFPLCVTAIKSLTGENTSIITAFRCGNNRAKGSKLVLETKVQRSNSASSSTASSESTTTLPTATTSASNPTSHGARTPAGSIVGGVIGGLAVIGLTIAGVVYMILRSRRRNTDAAGVPSPPYTYAPTGPATDPQPPVSHEAYKGYYQSGIRSAVSPVAENRNRPGLIASSGTTPQPASVYRPTARSPPPMGEGVCSPLEARAPDPASELPSVQYNRDQC